MNPAILTTALEIVEGIIKMAPAIQQGVASAAPYVTALVQLLEGSQVTPQQLDAAVMQIRRLSDEIQKPLPPDDGTTSS